MRSRLMRDAFFMAVCPFVSVILIAAFWGDQSRCLEIVLTGTLVQVVITLFCRKGARLLYAPSRENMLRMGTERIPAAYEPGKYDRDHHIAGGCTFLGAAAPALGYLAQLYPETVTNAMLDQLSYETANLALLGVALVCTLVGSMGLIIWVKVGQVREIANEGGENRRYLLRGFAEAVEDRCFLFDYLHGQCLR